MQFELSDHATLSLTSADFGEQVEIQMLSVSPSGKIQERTSPSKMKPKEVMALAQALIGYAIACGTEADYNRVCNNLPNDDDE